MKKTVCCQFLPSGENLMKKQYLPQMQQVHRCSKKYDTLTCIVSPRHILTLSGSVDMKVTQRPFNTVVVQHFSCNWFYLSFKYLVSFAVQLKRSL